MSTPPNYSRPPPTPSWRCRSSPTSNRNLKTKYVEALKDAVEWLGFDFDNNVHFKSSVNQTPRKAQSGLPGTKGTFNLELKVLADVGLVGLQ